jgi:DNA-binding transcriptional regulator YiaG
MTGAQTQAAGELNLVSLVEIRAALATGRVRELRQRARLSQSEFARAIGVSPAAVSRWESQARQPSEESAERLVRIMRVLERAAAP